MPRILRFLSCFAFIAAAGAAIAAAPAGEPQGPPPRPIPGLTAPDQFPRGCVDCHVVIPDRKMDVRLSTLMRQWQDKVEPALLERVRPFTPGEIALKGKHPKFEVAGAEVPKACLTCHARTSKAAPPLGRMLHGLHLVGGEKNHFLTQFQGECTHCHRLETATGNWVLKSGAEPK
ncbi:MAG: hypothetical protein JSW31_13730 [Burkholderiales bacterium]|nr:MAG: hypothetical protein JSW31_13730 [Burkholderiales bacterium]